MKLKTLKDFDFMWVKSAINRNDLKAEAIKWVKAKGIRLSRSDWEYFFNITEEDLK